MFTKKRWREDEVEFLKQNYEHLGPTSCARALDRTWNSVHERAKRLGLRCFHLVGQPKKNETR
jgi:hypothetical protein